MFDAMNFEQLLHLNRWSRINFLNSHQLIDWELTWSLLNYFPETHTTATNFNQSASFCFNVKLISDELPWLSVLQTRNPALYLPEWNCLLCHNDKEDYTHIWSCAAIQDTITNYITNAKLLFMTRLRKELVNVSQSIETHILQQDCWSLSNGDTSIISLDLMIKGFVPTTLLPALANCGNKQQVRMALIKALTDIRKLFHQEVWLKRCHEFALGVTSVGITKQDKKKGSHHFGTRNTSAQSRTEHTSQYPPNSPRWKKWIARALSDGIPWMGFHIYINSLVFR